MKTLLSLLAAAALMPCLSLSASAQFVDTVGDFLPTYTGPQNGDLDVVFSNVTVTPTEILFAATLNGTIGTTANSLYVWGIDRGVGTPRLAAGNPSLGANIPFDSVVTVTGAGVGTARDLSTGGATTSNLNVTLSGNSLLARVPFSALPSKGFALDQYTWNLWPRLAGGTNANISDFAPDASNLRVSVVPEPGSVALLIGFCALSLCLAHKSRHARA